MRKSGDEQAEIEAAKERLKRFCKPAHQCKNYHDPNRLARAREGKEFEPQSWRDIGRWPHKLW